MAIEINFTAQPGWRYIGVPPSDGFRQYAWLWHIELVLRHFVYTSSRQAFGKDFLEVLHNVRVGDDTRLDETVQRDRQKALSNHGFTREELPTHFWFLTTAQLVEVITNKKNWDQVFGPALEGVERKPLLKVLNPISSVRNCWAHFRAAPPEQAGQALKNVAQILRRPLFEWTARYHNSVDDGYCDQEPDFAKLYNSNPEPFVPLIFKPVPGYHGGLADPASQDRGWSLLVQRNWDDTAIWVTPTRVGASDLATLEEANRYARELGDHAIHVKFKFDEGGPAAADLKRDRMVRPLSISLAANDGPEEVATGLRIISETARKLPFQTRKDPIQGPDLLFAEKVQRFLFFEARFNVIVDPTQERPPTFP